MSNSQKNSQSLKCAVVLNWNEFHSVNCDKLKSLLQAEKSSIKMLNYFNVELELENRKRQLITKL